LPFRSFMKARTAREENRMKGHIARHISPAVIALFALCFVETRANAQNPPRAFQIVSAGGDVGLTRGQALRYTWVNLNEPDPRTREFELLGIQVRLLAASGIVIAQAAAPAVGAGAFQAFDFIRDQINLPGEPGTGRLQVRLDVSVYYARARGSEAFDITRQVLDAFDDGLEVIDRQTGRTAVSSKPKEIVVVGSKPAPDAGSAGQDSVWIDLGSPVGIAAEQTLRIAVFNPLPPAPPGEDGRKYVMLVAPVILDADGQVIARPGEVSLAPGQSHSFDFRRSDLPAAGEPGTGRLQVRSAIQRRFFPGIVSRISAGQVDRFPGALELVDQSTGTTMLLLPAVQAAREAARRIQ